METEVQRQIQTRRFSPEELAIRLKGEAEINPAFAAVCLAWSMRERTRRQVMLSTLVVAMAAEGYNFAKEEYAKVLEFMASVGLGRLERDSKGRIRGLKDITVTLQSIGLASVSNKALIRFNPPKPFTRLRELPAGTIKQLPKAPVVAIVEPPKKTRVDSPLVIKHGDKTFTIENFPEERLYEVLNTLVNRRTK